MKKILVIAAHPDDELLGCGGTLLHYKQSGYKIKIIFLSDGESSRPNKKSNIKKLILKRANQAELICKKCKFLKPVFGNLPDNRLDTVSFLSIVKLIEKEIKNFKPEIIFTHFENDLNIDHQLTFKAVITATRPLSKSFVKKILSFEIPSSTDFNFTKNNKKIFNPNYYVNISNFVKKKSNLIKIYKDELRPWPHPRSIKSIENLAKYRGSQIGIKYAEAFILIRQLS
jgi:LmbE family N-acetylglucosaminyl deacetylase